MKHGKTTPFRKGQKQEIGFDLKKNHTGKPSGKLTTAEGENLFNFMEQGDYKLGKK